MSNRTSLDADTIRLSIVIVSWNVAEYLVPCLTSLQEAHGATLHRETIVVDNGSSDRTVEVVRERFPDVILLPLARNVGFAAASNIGIRHATGDQILLLNPDTQVSVECLETCSEALQARPDVGLLGCKLLDRNGEIQYECASSEPSLLDAWIEVFYLHMILPKSRICGRLRMSYWDHEDTRYVDRISGAFMMLRRAVVDDLGSLDENFFMYYEDLEYCARAKRHGWKVLYLATATAVHYGGRSRAKSDAPFDSLAPEIRFTFFRDYRGPVVAHAFRALYAAQSIIRLWIAGCCKLVLPRQSPWRKRPVAKASLHWERLKWCVGLSPSARKGAAPFAEYPARASERAIEP